VTEWRLGSVYHTGLALALLLSAGALYGVYRTVIGLTLLGLP